MTIWDICEDFANKCDAEECAKELLDNEALCLDAVEVVRGSPQGKTWDLRIKVNAAQGTSGQQYDLGHCNGFIWGYKRAMEICFMMDAAK